MVTWGTVPPEVRAARKFYEQTVVSGREPCEACHQRQQKLHGPYCTACASARSRYSHPLSGPPPRLYELEIETELIAQIIRVNREALAPGPAFFDSLLDSVKAGVSPLSERVTYLLSRLAEVNAKGEMIFTAFCAPFANLYLERRWTSKFKPFSRWTIDDANAKAFAAQVVFLLRRVPKALDWRIQGTMRREFSDYVCAHIGPLVYHCAKAAKETVEKRKLNAERLAEVKLKIPE